MRYYLTFNDQYSGIYQSQVIDVINFIEELSNTKIKLLAFVPINSYFSNRKKIQHKRPNSTIFPMVFGITQWKLYKHFIRLFIRNKDVVICRGPLSTILCLGLFKKVVYDGRSAVKAEVEEYDIVLGNKKLGNEMIVAEKISVLQSHFKIAVSNKLIDYWTKELNYLGNNHVVIPCTLASDFKTDASKYKKNIKDDIIKVVYSGSTSEWQSFPMVVKLLNNLLSKQVNINVLFLCSPSIEIDALMTKYPSRCFRKYVTHEKVYSELVKCDYGILIRDDYTTNRVASPVKYAEYLSAGLKVLISKSIGDYSQFTIEHDAGLIIEEKIPELRMVSINEKNRMIELTEKYFRKNSITNIESYKKIISFIN